VTKDQLAVLEKPSLPSLPALPHEYQSMRCGWGKVNPRYWTNVDDKIRQTVMVRQAP